MPTHRTLACLILCAGLTAAPTARAAQTGDDGSIVAAQRHIAAREYWATRSGERLQAPNREHDLRTWFDASGVRVEQRTRSGAPLVELSLARFGRGDALRAVKPGVVSSHEGRVEIRREEVGLVEWYVNSPAGLEHGFTLGKRPAALLEEELVFELSVEGAKASRRGDGAALATPTGRKLAYEKLVATDALGMKLPARLDVPGPDRIRLIVADAGAVYPLTIDPLLTGSIDTRLEGNQANARAGYALASAGDVNGDGYADVLVGAHGYDDGQADEGAVFLFLGNPSGIADGGPAEADAVLVSNQAGALFGYSVDSAGDVNGDGYDDVIIGAPYFDSGHTDEGTAYVFHGSATGLVGSDPLTAATELESNQTGSVLGYAVAGVGDVNGDGYDDVMVGAPFYDAGHTDEGAAWIFHGGATGISDGIPTTAASEFGANQNSAELGVSLAGAGDVNGDGYDDVIVGAQRYNVTYTDAGVASIFLGSPSGVANGTPTTAHANIRGNQASAFMGHAVASAGDVNGDGYADVMASATGYDDGQTDEGIVSLLFGGPGGMPGDFTPSTVDDGIASDQAGALLGERIGTLGDVNGDGYADVAVGAHLYDDGETDEGCAWIFFGGPNGIAAHVDAETPATADVAMCRDQAGARFGANVTGAGDVDGDGYADLLVGAYLYDSGETDEGAAFVYRGSAGGIVDAVIGDYRFADARFNPTAVFGATPVIDWYFGWSVASAGDIDGDGYDDLLVGAPFFDAGEIAEGAVFVFHGWPYGTEHGVDYILESDQEAALMGKSVAPAGDVNGDGYADVIVGIPAFANGQSTEGAAVVFLGSPTGLLGRTPASAHAVIQSDQSGASMGISVASAGDVNGDGFGDVIVGTDGYSSGESLEGAAFVFLGSSTGIGSGTAASAHAQLESDQAGAHMGCSVAGAGDVNGDGYGDVVIGARFYDAGQIFEGAAFVFLGSPAGVSNGTPATADATLQSNFAGGRLGTSVASAGDVNGDGYSDVIVGADGFYYSPIPEILPIPDPNPNPEEGGAFVFLGSPAGIIGDSPLTAHARFEGNQTGALLGWSVASAGDINGDGYSDVIVGIPFWDNGRPNEGAAKVFLGSPTGIDSGDLTPSGYSRVADAQIEGDGWPESGFGAYAWLGYSVASAGDFNADGFADLVVGAPFYDFGLSPEGLALVFLGNSLHPVQVTGATRPRLVRQRRGDGSGIAVQPWGSSASEDAFQVELRGTHPAGNGRVRLEVETCASGVAFGDSTCITSLSSSWTPVGDGVDDALLSADVIGLSANTLYRWRARVQYADTTGPVPIQPSHGPWVRLSAQAREGDIRTAATSTPTCDNGLDDDADGAADFPNDPGCTSAADSSEQQAGLACDDGLDNDGDGLADYRIDGTGDPACRSVVFDRENAQCQDGISNDGDGLIDFDGGASHNGGVPLTAPDPQCASKPWRNDEKADSCGLGFEIALALSCLAFARRRLVLA